MMLYQIFKYYDLKDYNSGKDLSIKLQIRKKYECIIGKTAKMQCG